MGCTLACSTSMARERRKDLKGLEGVEKCLEENYRIGPRELLTSQINFKDLKST